MALSNLSLSGTPSVTEIARLAALYSRRKSATTENETQANLNTTNSATDSPSRGLTQDQTSGDESRDLARLAPARAQLSPSDEVSLFADAAANQSTALTATDSTTVQGEAVAEDGSAVGVDIIKPENAELQPTSAQILSLNTNAIASAAAVYAHNQQSVYDITALAAIAA